MDRMWVCGTYDRGSIPRGSTQVIEKATAHVQWPFLLESNLRCFRAWVLSGAMIFAHTRAKISELGEEVLMSVSELET